MPHSPASRKRKVSSDEEVSAKRSRTTTEDEDSGVEDDEKEIDEDENEDEDEPTASKTVRVGKMDVDDNYESFYKGLILINPQLRQIFHLLIDLLIHSFPLSTAAKYFLKRKVKSKL